MDDNTHVCGSPTDEEIVAEFTQPLTEELSEDDEGGEDDEKNTPAHISYQDALTTVETLMQFLELKDNVPDFLYQNIPTPFLCLTLSLCQKFLLVPSLGLISFFFSLSFPPFRSLGMIPSLDIRPNFKISLRLNSHSLSSHLLQSQGELPKF